ncbi:adenylate/guanylate cyclase domain-containing protein [Tautonia plasticadhaerens]|uniref:Adenylate and Guanylate cyclase catalytic domain protein n=1 Tax=Tautonia plasticadhaerens TaxID=2527974 RepID=A0A518HEK8_9BACT|nr:adenylate/guanylate cyclase domain-containing protein [Tautonia plasticadhaerens]QDV39274.1 Adenylate and Guanylate cyclase catalytic domain protein [Tautonia plasticadhaerens]
MAWDEQRARRRVSLHGSGSFEVNVSDLRRDTDFTNLGTKDVRRVQGVHIYVDVPNFHLAVGDAGGDKREQKRLIRAASVLRKVQGDLLREDEIKPIQLQAARLHCLNFKPYDHEDEEECERRVAERAKRAVIMGITLNSYLYDVFNGVFSEVRNLRGAVGIAAGQSYVANIGFHGERERICLGSCANLGAKILDGGGTITLTRPVYDALPECLKGHFSRSRTVSGEVTYQAKGLRWKDHADLAEELGVRYDEDALREKTEGYRDELPLDQIEVVEAGTLIDPDVLTERRCKRTDAIAIFADIDGFTKYVQRAESDDSVASLVRKLHMIRREFHAVIKKDYEGLVIQHQGDRVIALVHTPTGDEGFSDRCRNAVDLAVGIQSSMAHVLNEHLGEQKDLKVAIGLDVGRTLVTRLGKQGRRIVIVLGPEVESAEDLQLRSGGGEIRISRTIHDALPEGTLKGWFRQDGSGAFVAEGLTFPRLDEIEEEESARANRLAVKRAGGGFGIITPGGEPTRPAMGASKPWSGK